MKSVSALIALAITTFCLAPKLLEQNISPQTSTQEASKVDSPFQPGEIIPRFGKIAKVKTQLKIPDQEVLRIRFDVAEQAKAGEINRTFDSCARLINLHHAHGGDVSKLKIAVVIHGSAVFDVVNETVYGIKNDGDRHGSLDAVRVLHQQGVRFYVCGQSAAGKRLTGKDFLPPIIMAPSAMTAHAILDSQKYALNPF